jgi:hypothetical protein
MDKKILTDFDILLKGQLTVNLPVSIIMIVMFFGLAEFTQFSFSRNVIISFISGWISWGFLVRNWILWQIKMKFLMKDY